MTSSHKMPESAAQDAIVEVTRWLDVVVELLRTRVERGASTEDEEDALTNLYAARTWAECEAIGAITWTQSQRSA